MTDPAASSTTRGRIAAVALSVVLLAALLFPASAIDENQAPPTTPELTLQSLTNGTFLGAVRDSLSANFGLKVLAVRGFADAHLAVGLSPSAAVYLGSEGEPFLSEDFSNACNNDLQAAGFGEAVDDLTAAQASAGREFLLAVVPDKSSIERDILGPFSASLLACSDRNRAYLESLPTIMTTFNDFEASPDRLYTFGDSHWNYIGASRFAVQLLDRLQPGIVHDGDLVESPVQHEGDLFALMGAEQQESLVLVTAERPDITTGYESETTSLGYTVQRWQSSGEGALIAGRTLIVVDSTFGYNSQVYAPYFEDLTSIPIQSLADPGAIASIGNYDRVIVQRVQRGLPGELDLLLTADWL